MSDAKERVVTKVNPDVAASPQTVEGDPVTARGSHNAGCSQGGQRPPPQYAARLGPPAFSFFILNSFEYSRAKPVVRLEAEPGSFLPVAMKY